MNKDGEDDRSVQIKCVCDRFFFGFFQHELRNFGKIVISWSKFVNIIHLSMQEPCPSAIKEVCKQRLHVKRLLRGCFRWLCWVNGP